MLPQVSIFTYMCVCCVLRIELATWQRRRRSRRRVADTFVVVVAVFFILVCVLVLVSCLLAICFYTLAKILVICSLVL